MNNRGLFVVFEGINGAGKTTIINEITSSYDAANIAYSVYKFPDRNGMHGDCIDKYLKGLITIDSKYDVLDMFAANRFAIIKNIINDILNGKIVLCDRYIFSAIAYHVPMSSKSLTFVHRYCETVGYFDKYMPIPDVVYLIDGDHISKRVENRNERFHYDSNKNALLNMILFSVISFYTNNFRVIKNELEGQQCIARYIQDDISYVFKKLLCNDKSVCVLHY